MGLVFKYHSQYLNTFNYFADIEQNKNTKVHSVCSMVTHKIKLSSIISFTPKTSIYCIISRVSNTLSLCKINLWFLCNVL